MPNEPPKPIASADVPWEEWSEVPRFGVRYRPLALNRIGEDYHVGVAIEELPPGKRTAPTHYHIFEEEHVFILEGTLTVRIGDERYPMRAGDYVCFPAGQRIGHCLSNEGDAPCRYVIIGENNPNEVAVYPDSNKVLVRALGRRAIFDMDALRGYWHGEETGLPVGEVARDEKALTPADGAKPHPPISSGDVAWQPQAHGERFGGRAKHLTHSAVGENYRVGVLIESPAPGMRLCPLHYHMLEEEHALVLEGEVTLLLGDERHVMKPGDYVGFPAGLKIGHSFMNSGAGPSSYLMIGERNAADVCVYPHSNKLAVNALRSQDSVFDMSAVRDYWDGEGD
jgi:uncharacterized cupin superfamily protein